MSEPLVVALGTGGLALVLGAALFWDRRAVRRLLGKMPRPADSGLVPPVTYSGPRDLEALAAEVNRLSADRNRLVVEQRAFERLRREFLSSVSHDLRTPLTSIVGYLQAVRDDHNRSGTIQAAHLEVLETKARHLKDRLEMFFDLVKAQSGDSRAEPVCFDPAAALREVLVDFVPQIEAGSVDLDLRLPEDRIQLWFDRQDFLRILQNLIQNALVHGGCGRWLGVTLARTSGGQSVTVADHGPGIRPGDLPFVFDRGRRFHPRPGSSGLGLAIVRELADRNGARVSVALNPGGGAVFTLELPDRPPT